MQPLCFVFSPLFFLFRRFSYQDYSRSCRIVCRPYVAICYCGGLSKTGQRLPNFFARYVNLFYNYCCQLVAEASKEKQWTTIISTFFKVSKHVCKIFPTSNIKRPKLVMGRTISMSFVIVMHVYWRNNYWAVAEYCSADCTRTLKWNYIFTHLVNLVLFNHGFSLGNRNILENVRINNPCCVGMYCVTTFSIRPSN